MQNLKLTARTLKFGCGIYEAGNPEKCYVKLFVTDGGRVLPVNHRAITEEDLMEAYCWGRMEAREEIGLSEIPDIPEEQPDPPEIEDCPF